MGIVQFDLESEGEKDMLPLPAQRPARRTLSGRRGSEVQAQFVLKMYEEARANEPFAKPNETSTTANGEG